MPTTATKEAKEIFRGFLIDLTAVTLSEGEESTTRIPLAMTGTFWKGKQKFTIGRNDVKAMAENFAKRGNGEVVMDYEHASEHPELAAGGAVPAAGWIVSMDDAPDAEGIVWGKVKFTDKARSMISAKEYKYISPVIVWGARDKENGDPQGATLSSAALTNRPFLDRMPAIRLCDAGWQSSITTEGEQTNVSKEKLMCSEHPKTAMLCPQCDSDEIKSLSAAEHAHAQPKVIRLTDLTRDAAGRISLTGLGKDGATVSIEVVNAMETQRVALSEVDAALNAGKITPAQKEHWTRIALSDVETFRALTKDLKQVDLSERGTAGEGRPGGATELARLDADLRTKALARQKEAGGDYGSALKFVASENPELTRRRLELMRSNGGSESEVAR
jgi:phage I-like protein